MRLLQAIHERWSAAEGLHALLPASRVHTGINPDSSLPRAVLNILANRPLAACNDGSAIDIVGVRVEIFTADYDEAEAIVEQLTAAFDQAHFALAGDDRMNQMRRGNTLAEPGQDGAWRMVVEFECVVYRAPRT